jgi:hypothetical protein
MILMLVLLFPQGIAGSIAGRLRAGARARGVGQEEAA